MVRSLSTIRYAAAAHGSFPPVFAPNPFLEGSSIGHWSFATGTQVVMLGAVDRGEQRRTFAGWELQALADLGYGVAEDGFPTDGGVPDRPTDPPSVPDPPIDSPSADPAPADSPRAMGTDEETVTSPAGQPSGGCSVSGTQTGAIWPIMLALLVSKRRRHHGRKPRQR